MKIKSIITAYFLCIAFFAGAQQKYKTSPDGLKYKLFAKGKGNKPGMKDIMKFDYLIKNEKDSVFNSSYKTGQPVMVQMQASAYKGDPMEGFGMMSPGDSAVFSVPADSFFKEAPQNPFKKGETVILIVKMLDVKTLEEYQKEMDKENMESALKEITGLDALIKNKYPNAIKTASGMYYIITKPGTGANAMNGNTVSAHYKGMFPDGRVFDTDSGRADPFAFKLGGHQVIAGWDEGFTYLNKGAKAILILPSKLAYGPQGNQGIPPNSTLVFEVELIDFK